MSQTSQHKKPEHRYARLGVLLAAAGLVAATAAVLARPSPYQEPTGPASATTITADTSSLSCDELAEVSQEPAAWVSPEGHLALDRAEAAHLMSGLGTGTAAAGDSQSPKSRIRDLLSVRLDGNPRPLKDQERTDLEHLQLWSHANCP